ncbi:penicillin-binding protein [Bacillus sp. 1P06AnD]|uniref:penicillin-binding protein n=1 Tax=Bacillus sp. 1P06AnD TaxID=3132208 RepID=UPI0039A07643
MKRNQTGAHWYAFFFLVLLIVIGFRILYIQLSGQVDGRVLSAIAENKYNASKIIPGIRGSIVDEQGNILAEDAASYDLIAVLDPSVTLNRNNPHHVQHPAKTARKLAPILEMDESELTHILSKDAKQVEFGKKGLNLTLRKKEMIEKLNLPGIGFRRSTKRFYPNGNYASYVIGMTTTKKENRLAGVVGIEKSLQSKLQGKDGFSTQSESLEGYRLPMAKTTIVPPRNGSIVTLTLDHYIQSLLETNLNKVQALANPKKMIAVVSDPKTGKILGMSSRPSYDPNKKDISYFNNDAISYAYEPGSTMKMITLASSIEEGVYNGNELYKSGNIRLSSGRPIKDHNDGSGWGVITFDEGIRHSSNVAMVRLTQKMGTDALKKHIEQFGLMKKTGIDLPNEINSHFNFERERDQLSTSFGQASAVTPIQQIQAASALANNGKMMKPYVISNISDSVTGKIIKQTKPKVVGQPISAETAKKTMSILETVVSSKIGTGRAFQLNDFTVAGKTGTAQIAENGKYLEGNGQSIFSFMGFAPADDPQLVVYIAIQQPDLSKGYTGNQLLADLFNPTMETSLKYLAVKPDKKMKEHAKKSKKQSIGSFVGMNREDAKEELEEQGFIPVVFGDGDAIEDQSPQPGINELPGTTIFLKSNGKRVMPDLTGYSLRDANKAARLLDLDLTFKGSGYVVSQNAVPGLPLNGKHKLIVHLKTRK